jgi:predicted ATPase
MSIKWYVITGGPSTGKTTLLAELEKLGYKTIPEAARTVIDQAIAAGQTVEELRADEKSFQDKVAKLKEKIEAELDRNVVTFFDRGMHDTLAYMRHYEFKIEDWVHDLLSKSTYDKVFLLDPLPNYEKDYARTEAENFVGSIQKLLHEAYTKFGMEPIQVPVLEVTERAKFVLKHVEEEH